MRKPQFARFITLVETHFYYLDEFEGLSVAHNFAGGQNDNNK